MVNYNIENIQLLNIYDMNILKSFTGDTGIFKNMSIFSKEGTYCVLGDYSFFKTNSDINIYYISQLSLFIDENKKILFDSKYYFFNSPDYFIKNIDNILNTINKIDLNNKNITDIGNDIISIEKWFSTYGHYKDEAYNLCDFKNKLKLTYLMTKINYKILLDYKINNLGYNISNYEIIQKYLFDNSAINASEHNIIKMKNLMLIVNNYNDKTFHSFPVFSRNLILSKIETKNYNYEKIYITRGIATHLTRNFSNEEEIKGFLLCKKFFIVNPELQTLDNFINIIKNAKTIVLTWGSALTNMVYLKPNTNVYILKSESYQHETIELFMKIIKNYNLKIHIITHINNKITIDKLEEIN